MASITLSTHLALAEPLAENEQRHARFYAAMSRAVLADATAICASSGAVGLGTTAQSAKMRMPSVPVGRAFGKKHYECARYHTDAGHLDDLEGRAEHVACGIRCTGYLAVGVACLNHEATQIEWVGGCETGLFRW